MGRRRVDQRAGMDAALPNGFCQRDNFGTCRLVVAEHQNVAIDKAILCQAMRRDIVERRDQPDIVAQQIAGAIDSAFQPGITPHLSFRFTENFGYFAAQHYHAAMTPLTTDPCNQCCTLQFVASAQML